MAHEDNKKWLAGSLYYLHESSTGSVDGDIRKLSTLVQGYVVFCASKSQIVANN